MIETPSKSAHIDPPPDVTDSVVRGHRASTPDQAMWFGDPKGVQGAPDITWLNLPNKPSSLTINNKDNYNPPLNSIEGITMTGLANWATDYSITFTNSSTSLATLFLVPFVSILGYHNDAPALIPNGEALPDH